MRKIYFILFMVGVFLVIMVYGLFWFMSIKVDKGENILSSYECGFDQGIESRVSFSYRFFLISILFLVFDVEITLLVPVPLAEVGVWGLIGMGVFMIILFVGLVYEYYNGVLDWVE